MSQRKDPNETSRREKHNIRNENVLDRNNNRFYTVETTIRN